VDDDRCVHCGRCSQACRYGAIACVPQRTIVFVELCHACGGCLLACPAEAIREVPRSIGWLRYGTCGSLEFVEGELHVGEAMSPPAIRAVKRTALDAELTLWDCPPGTSCAVIESVRGCDLLVLVTEPTPFGLHDLKLAVDMARSLQLPLGVVVNRADAGERELWGYCAREGLPILAEIPDDRAVAEAYARGILAAQAVPQVAHRLRRLLDTIASGATA
jgi:MinD superfamily P-loop ATPase